MSNGGANAVPSKAGDGGSAGNPGYSESTNGYNVYGYEPSTQAGSDGSSTSAPSWWGGIHPYIKGGTGQGTTTRAFGESSGTLYAGGGGGGASREYGMDNRGGNGGGGNGSWYYPSTGVTFNAAPGGTNTGGGGGGGYGYNNSYGVGGSGIAIIRWGY